MAKSTATKVRPATKTSTKEAGRGAGKASAASDAKGKKSGKSGETSRKTKLRSAGADRVERRFVPRASAGAVGSALATSIGGVCAGAGVWGKFALNYHYAPHLLGVGAVLAAIGLITGKSPVAIRVGDLGIGIEKDQETIERMAWYEIDAVRFASNTLSFTGRGRVLSISTVTHPEAAALALAEARARIPARVVDVADTGLPPSSSDAGELIRLEPLQLAGLRCKATDRIIAVEKDGKYCAQCGQTYHREAVPGNCLTCDARLA
jgi:hypothetical protein